MLLPLLVSLTLALAPTSNDDICNTASGSISVEYSNDPGFENLYKYTITLDKSDEDEDDEFGFFLMLDILNCECQCEPGFIVFPPVAGEIIGTDHDDNDGACTVTGEYLCLGSPEIPTPLNGPAIRFIGGESDNCNEDDDFVQQSVWFYTPLPPGDAVPHPIILVDDLDDDDHDGVYDDADEEDGHCFGEIFGSLPLCDCSVETESDRWGSVKSRFGI